jgi:hypothetical protein
MRFLSFMPMSRLIKNKSTHMAQGLNPSAPASTSVTKGKDKFLIFISPSTGTMIVEGNSALPVSAEQPHS